MAKDGGMHQGPHDHDHHREDLLRLGVGRHVAEADGGEGGAGEVECSDVSIPVLKATINTRCCACSPKSLCVIISSFSQSFLAAWSVGGIMGRYMARRVPLASTLKRLTERG